MTLLTFLDIKAEAEAEGPLEELIPFLALSKHDMAKYMKYTVGITVCYYSAVWSAKGSFLAMYFDLGEKLNKGMRKALLLATIFTGATWVAVVIINLMWCRPLSRTWSVSYPPYQSSWDLLIDKSYLFREVVIPTDPQYCMYLDLPILAIHFSFNISTDLFRSSSPPLPSSPFTY